MKMKVVETRDGSKTIFVSDLNEIYHSLHGALSEAKHVFIKNGLQAINKEEFFILDIGFGTGLNAFLTFLENNRLHKKIHYTALEPFPVEYSLLKELDYANISTKEMMIFFDKIYDCRWGYREHISNNFLLEKILNNVEDVDFKHFFDLIYFDAFSPRVQPEIWSEKVFTKLYDNMNKEAILVTYCAKGSVKRILRSVGFQVESLKGPIGKREMIRAKKSN